MSITVSALMNLPSLHRAKIVAGYGGLDRNVSSISVLEASMDDMLPIPRKDDSNWLASSRLIITGFLNCPNNEERQCELVRRLIQDGEVGIIVYYVGVFVPRLGEKLKALCNENNFVLICMPEKDFTIRYGEVIVDVMDLIIRDRMEYMHFTNELLVEISTMPQQQHSVDTMLQLISERLHISLVLTDNSYRVLNSSAWPRRETQILEENLQHALHSQNDRSQAVLPSGWTVCRSPISSDNKQCMELFLFRDGHPLNREAMREVTDLVQLSVNLWESHHEEVAVIGLIRAILQDEPLKMRGLAKIFGIDVSKLHAMGILHTDDREHSVSSALQMQIEERLKQEYDIALSGIHDGHLIFLTDNPSSIANEEVMLQDILEIARKEHPSCTLTFLSHLDTTAETAAAFSNFQNALADARKIFPMRKIFHRQDLEFATMCRNQISGGTDGVQKKLSVLRHISSETDGDEFLDTLAVFLLDTACSHVETGQKLYLHKNTIKYRIRRCSDLLGLRIGSFPESFPAFEALAIRRLLQ